MRSKCTIIALKNAGAAVVIGTHLGRPKGKKDPKYSVSLISGHLSELLGVPVKMATDSIGSEVDQLKSELNPGDILLLENLRFHEGETNNEDAFSKALSKGLDYFVQDAFGVVHRAHASTVGIASFLPAYAGLLLEKETVFFFAGII